MLAAVVCCVSFFGQFALEVMVEISIPKAGVPPWNMPESPGPRKEMASLRQKETTDTERRRILFLFPTCQVRVVRFYQSCSSPPRLALLLFLLLLFLASSSSSSSFSSTMSASTSTSTSALPTLRQALCQLSSSSSLPTSQLSVHRWTSTWDLPSSVRTAGPQPGTFPAQCALLDLNLGPSQLSVHRWTSTAR